MYAQYPSNQYGGVSVGAPYQGGIPSQSGVPYYGGVPSQPQIYSGRVPSQTVTPYNGAQPVIAIGQRPKFPPCGCCGCSPESGARIVFAIDAILSFIGAISSISVISEIAKHHQLRMPSLSETLAETFCFAGSSWLTAYGLEAASDVMYAIGSIITLIGILTRKIGLLYAYPVGLAFRLLLVFIAGILTSLDCGKYILWLVLCVGSLWYFYALWVAYCFGNYLKKGGQTGGIGMYQYQTSPLPLGSTGNIPNPTVPQAIQPRSDSGSDDNYN